VKLPTLFKKTSGGQIEQWTIWVETSPTINNPNTGESTYDIVTEYGHVGGKLQQARENVAEGKNLGKKNATTAQVQAESQAQAEYTMKLSRKGYVDDIAKAQAGENAGAGGIRPMLAKPFEDCEKKFKYPCYAQPKLDGMRCIAVVNDDGSVGLWTREQKPIVSVPVIANAVANLGLTPGTVLDGELYRHVEDEEGSEVELSRGLKAIVSKEDADEVNQYKWSASANGYAVRATPRSEGKETVYMHRQLLGAPEEMDVDHINGNKLDNRRTNLRLCTTSQNMGNSKTRVNSQSGLKGVYFYQRDNNWQAQITHEGKKHHLGYFDTAQEAAEAYDKAAKKLFGAFARTNSNADGEFEEIISVIRKQEPATPEAQAVVQYHVYDMPRDGTNPGAGFGDRTVKLGLVMAKARPMLKLVETQLIRDREELLAYRKSCQRAGYEGAMARSATTPYEEGKRSANLLKLKEFLEEDFPIVGVEEGIGKMAGCAIFVCTTDQTHCRQGCEVVESQCFRVKLEGELEGLKKYLTDESTWRDKKLSVKFFSYTNKNRVPRFPVGKIVRDYE
jgi:hypothetical protein